MMDLAAFWPFRPSRADLDADRLLDAVTQAARRPVFFGEGRAPDTLEGRLEVMTLHAVLALIRLHAEPVAAPLAQAFADKLFRQFDAGLREAAVGDLTVPKRMRRIASGFYGRLAVYAEALKANDIDALTASLRRNVFAADANADPFARTLAAYMTRLAVKQASSPLEALFQPDAWSPAPA